MHVFGYLVHYMSRFFRFYSRSDKVYPVILFVDGLILRDVSDRYGLTYARQGERQEMDLFATTSI